MAAADWQDVCGFLESNRDPARLGFNPPGRLGSECPVVLRSVSVSSLWTFALAESCSGVRSFPLAELI